MYQIKNLALQIFLSYTKLDTQSCLKYGVHCSLILIYLFNLVLNQKKKKKEKNKNKSPFEKQTIFARVPLINRPFRLLNYLFSSFVKALKDPEVIFMHFLKTERKKESGFLFLVLRVDGDLNICRV